MPRVRKPDPSIQSSEPEPAPPSPKRKPVPLKKTEHDITLGEGVLATLGDMGNSRNRFGGISLKALTEQLPSPPAKHSLGGNPNPNPASRFQPGNQFGWKPGQSGNPAGRPKLIGQAYKKVLAEEDENGITNAEKIAVGQVFKAIEEMDTNAAREIRLATEGETINIGKLGDSELDAKLMEVNAKIAELEGRSAIILPKPALPAPTESEY